MMSVSEDATVSPLGSSTTLDISNEAPLLQVQNLSKRFNVGSRWAGKAETVHAVNDLSFDLPRGRTLALVGESGSGKSTTGRTLLRLVEPTSGAVTFDGVSVLDASSNELRKLRGRMQMVFQDPYDSLNPRLRVGDAIRESLVIHRREERLQGAGRERILEIMDAVGLRPSDYHRYPHEFSGGQRQRVGLARALVTEPDLIVCDEPVSALDVSIQAQVLNLLRDLQDRLGLSYLFISHDLGVVRYVADEVAVMYLGHIVERGSAEGLFNNPLHPYTQALASAVPAASSAKERIILKGDIPSPVNLPSGCVFHTRCPAAMPRCSIEKPLPITMASGQTVSCHLYD